LLGVFDLRGEDFLLLYAGLSVLAIIAGVVIPRWLRPEGRMMPLSDPEQIAFLAGGMDRFAETVVAKLMANKAVEAGKARFSILDSSVGTTSAERAVLGLGVAPSWREIRKGLAQEASQIDERLSGYGLLMSKATALQMRFWQTSPYIVLMIFGAIKWQVGVARDKPVEFLTIALLVTLIAMLIRFFSLNRRTRAGVEALTEATANADRLSRAPLSAETGMAVALFGTSVLAGSQFANFHQLRSASSSSDSSSGCTSDSGGGGDSGGCGGCGGD
ncbi:MAG: TIGR04222 domain-containing membrane protein, partial [Novosphingobium sp.]|nr:TIGR04222 domain-containing membrane protein [Novosphingobium sp.]